MQLALKISVSLTKKPSHLIHGWGLAMTMNRESFAFLIFLWLNNLLLVVMMFFTTLRDSVRRIKTKC